MEDVETSIEAVRSVGENGIALTLSSPTGFEAAPGQFLNLTANVDGEDISRVYTISSPNVADTFEITVEVDPNGELSPWLGDADPGTTVRLSGPFGSAHYENEGDLVVIAGGPGIGPAVAITERALDDGGEAAVVYQDDSPLHESRLDDISDTGATVHVITPEENIFHAVEDALSGTDEQQVYVYGFNKFVERAKSAIEATGGDTSEVKVENFG
jgi:ferredoxin-NADP reductase